MKTGLFLLVAAIIVLVTSTAASGKPFDRPVDPAKQQDDCNLQGDSGLCLPLDATWVVVPMEDAVAGCYSNDDESSAEISLGFAFDLFGSPQTSLYINNNGNVSFGAPYSTYSPEGFPDGDYSMVAPFWGDVDTRSLADGAGTVWMKQGANYLAVTWDHVGYYSQHTDLQSTFQLIISDGTFGEMGLGNTVCFCYGDMEWTTGDASDGEGGFGGSPATVGVNKGDGIDFFNIGRFDHAGGDYAGPTGISGVDWLDFQQLCFNLGGETNQCPVAVDFPPNNAVVINEENPQLDLTVRFIGPEGGQTVTTIVDTGGLAGFNYTSTPGNPSVVAMNWTPTAEQVGTHSIVFQATDDFAEPCMTTITLTITVDALVPSEHGTWTGVKGLYR